MIWYNTILYSAILCAKKLIRTIYIVSSTNREIKNVKEHVQMYAQPYKFCVIKNR